MKARTVFAIIAAFLLGRYVEHQRAAVAPEPTIQPTADGYRDSGAFRAAWRGK